MSDSPIFLARRLAEEGEKVVAYFRGLSEQDWERIVYPQASPECEEPPSDVGDGEIWQVRDVLAHFVSSEAALVTLIADIVGGGEGAPMDVNIHDFNQKHVKALAGVSPEELLSELIESRRVMVEYVSSLTSEDMEKPGRHPFLGIMPLYEIIRLVYRHHQIHLRDVRQVLWRGGDELE